MHLRTCDELTMYTSKWASFHFLGPAMPRPAVMIRKIDEPRANDFKGNNWVCLGHKNCPTARHAACNVEFFIGFIISSHLTVLKNQMHLVNAVIWPQQLPDFCAYCRRRARRRCDAPKLPAAPPRRSLLMNNHFPPFLTS